MIIELVENEEGEVLIKKFLRKLGTEMTSDLYDKLEILEKFTCQELLENQTIKKMRASEQLYEIRIRVRGNNLRLFCDIRNETCFVVSGIKKQRQKTPINEIRTAIDRKKFILY